MPSHTSSLSQTVHNLLHASQPVSFYDALMLLRQIKAPPARVTNRTLAALMELYDAKQATWGAKQVLSRYLQTCAQEHERQRRCALQPLQLADGHKIVRVPPGQKVRLHLKERQSAGFRWAIREVSKPGKALRSPESTDHFDLAIFELWCERSATVRAVFVEQGIARAGTEQKPPLFEITMIVEEV